MADWQPRNMAPISDRTPIPGPDYGSFRPTYGASSSTRTWQPHYWYQPPLYRYATFWNRLGAFVLDVIFDWIGWCVVMVALWVCYAALGGPTGTDPDNWFGTIEGLIFLAPMIWKLAFVASGSTPGQRIVGLRITTIDGGKPGWSRSLRRNLPYLFFTATITGLAVLDLAGMLESSRQSLGVWAGVSWAIAALVFFASCLCCVGTTYGRTLHDRFAGTYVIRS